MEQKEILSFCLENGILLDRDVLKIFSEATDSEAVKFIIEKIKESTHSKIITKNIFFQEIKQFDSFSYLPGNKQESIEKLKIKLGLELEISREISPTHPEIQNNFAIKVFNFPTNSNKKINVDDFTKYFRNRFMKIKSILQTHQNLKNLVSINKISGNRQGISVIGLVSDKRTTKNDNIILELEDLTGKVKVLINKNKPTLHEIADEVTLDSVIGVSGSGNNEIIFANEIIFPDSFLAERKKSPTEEYALFIGDIHYGSKLFLKDNFNKFIDYINGKIPNTPEVNKIKYLFIIGDIVAGVGVYPDQENYLEVVDLEEQFRGIAELLSKIRKDVAIIINPGNHDCVRLMEPQPAFDKKYAGPLFELENVTLGTNPCYINMGAKGTFSGIDVLMYHGDSFFYYADNIPSLIRVNAKNAPDAVMTYLLRNRHLAPTHTSVQYFPLEEDPLVIDKVPDIFFSGHTHKCAITFYNNTLIISSATWESMTPIQETRGNEPDFCKVPILNLKTGGIKILDFE